MKSGTIVLLGVVLLTFPARADFLQDLGFALGKLGDKIENTFSSDPKPAPVPTAPSPIDPSTINWNPVPDDALWVPEHLVLPKPKPKPPAAYQIAGQIDDAPAPRAAPPRKPVQTVAVLAPLAGYTQAPERTSQPSRANPDTSPNTRPTERMPEKVFTPPSFSEPPTIQVKQAAAVKTVSSSLALPKGFILRYGTDSYTIADTQLKPSSAEQKLIQNVATLSHQPGYRIKLASVTSNKTNKNAAFSRALMIKQWLENAGVRPTQIDLDVRAANEDSVSLLPYKVQ